jgi:arylsulfatase A-like enzyme
MTKQNSPIGRRDFLRRAGCGALAVSLFPSVGSQGLPVSQGSAGKSEVPVSQGLESASAKATADKKPNILFILADQWRASAFGYAGDPNVKTPQIDKLAAQSLNFVNAVSVLPVCTPYRAALMTGRFPTTTGMFLNDLYLPDDELCLGEVFRDAGFATGYIGKWHLDGHGRSTFIPPERRQGFDYWKVAECDHDYNHSHYYTGNSPEKKFWPGYDSYAQTADAQAWLRDHAQSAKPFLLCVAFGTPHFPHATAPADLKALYPPEKLTLAANVAPEFEQPARRELQGYYAHCTALDRCVGDLLATLKQTGLLEKTIVIFTSDHGEMMGAHGVRPSLKQWPHDESAHIPFLLRHPRQPARKIATPINVTDVMPTLCGLTGVPVPKTCEGEDLSGVVTGTGAGPDRAALLMNVSPFIPNLEEYRGIRTSRYTFVRNLAGPWLLFDNQADPLQQHNLVGVAAHAALQKDLDARLQAELKKIGDEFKPRQYYLDKWGYTIAKHGSINYGPGAPIQTPRRPKQP